jgi:hypothetical protein
VIRIARVGQRFAASDPRFPRVVGYGDTEEDATRALEEKLPAKPPQAPGGHLLPLSPAHGIYARDRERAERSDDALDHAILVGSVDSNRRRH